MTNKSKEERAAYAREWRLRNKGKVKASNRRYYLKNKGWLNKSRTNPWMTQDMVEGIKTGNLDVIQRMERILRPNKDKLIGLEHE